MNPKTYYDIKSTYSLSDEKQFKNNLAFTSIVVFIKMYEANKYKNNNEL